jgi:hypothetical protein
VLLLLLLLLLKELVLPPLEVLDLFGEAGVRRHRRRRVAVVVNARRFRQ